MDEIARAVGEVLRRTRRQLGLTLGDVRARSDGRFKPSAVGAYERGERMLSLDRFCALAAIYATPPERLLSEALSQIEPEGRREMPVIVSTLSKLGTKEAELATAFVRDIQELRGDDSEVITLRSGDLEAMALSSRTDAVSLRKKLSQAIRT